MLNRLWYKVTDSLDLNEQEDGLVEGFAGCRDKMVWQMNCKFMPSRKQRSSHE